MVNFYRQDGIGKIAFNDGNIYVPQGNVTLLLDTTTEKIIVAEDERLIYWISLSQPLEVNGTQISGTDAEKLALIAPVFQNEGGGGGTGGASARFGVPGEDVTSDADRTVDMGGKALVVSNSQYTTIKSHSVALNSDVRLDVGQNIGRINWSDLQGDNNVELNAGLLGSGEEGAKPTAYMETNDYLNNKKSGIYVDADSIKMTLQYFDSNAEAVAALGVGKLYKSTTLINGSPIILITV